MEELQCEVCMRVEEGENGEAQREGRRRAKRGEGGEVMYHRVDINFSAVSVRVWVRVRVWV